MKKVKYTTHIFFISFLIIVYIISLNVNSLGEEIILSIKNKIFAVVTDESSTSTNIPAGDDMVNLLARLVYAEARGEPYSGQVAVAAVVLNRVKSSSFPNSISGVIYQKGAFNVVDDGQINLSPNSTSTVYKAAQEAMNGSDPTNGALYFYNPSKTKSKWLFSLPTTMTIGKHVFAMGE